DGRFGLGPLERGRLAALELGLRDRRHQCGRLRGLERRSERLDADQHGWLRDRLRLKVCRLAGLGHDWRSCNMNYLSCRELTHDVEAAHRKSNAETAHAQTRKGDRNRSRESASPRHARAAK